MPVIALNLRVLVTYLSMSTHRGCTVAKWSKVLLVREKINENQKDSGLAPGLGNLQKSMVTRQAGKLRLSYSSFDYFLISQRRTTLILQAHI